MKALTNIELIQWCKMHGVKNLSGIYFKDDLPTKLINDTYYIINLQSSSSKGSGTHWTVFYYNTKQSLYYDSFGFMCPEEVVTLIKPYLYSKRTIQSMDSSACGWYCLAFIVMTMTVKDKLRAFNSFVSLFNNLTSQNERVLQEILF
jgi:hypothetical protein